MGRKSKYTITQKVDAVLDYKNGKRSMAQICKDLGLNASGVDLYKWVVIYDKSQRETRSKIHSDKRIS